MAPVAISEETAVVPTKAQPVEKADEVEKEVTPLEAISHGDVLPGKPYSFRESPFPNALGYIWPRTTTYHCLSLPIQKRRSGPI